MRRYRLGEEPAEDLTRTTTAEERLEMVETLSVEAWALTGKPIPVYARHEIPVTLRPLRGDEPGD